MHCYFIRRNALALAIALAVPTLYAKTITIENQTDYKGPIYAVADDDGSAAIHIVNSSITSGGIFSFPENDSTIANSSVIIENSTINDILYVGQEKDNVQHSLETKNLTVTGSQKLAGSSYNKGIGVSDGAEAHFGGEYLRVAINKPDCTDSVVGIQVFNSDAEFSAQTVDIDVTARGSSSKWGFGLLVNGNGGKTTFTGGDVSIRAANSDYTAQTLTVKALSTLEFHNTGDIHVRAESAYGITAVDAYGTLVFDNAGNVLIDGALVPGTQTGQTNVVGMQGASANWSVTTRVNDFIIDMEGLGVDNNGTSYSTGTMGANLDGVTFNVASRTFTILMNTDADVEVTPPEDHTASKAYGLYLSEESEKPSVFTTSSNTISTIDVKNAVGSAYGIYVGMDDNRPDQAVTATFGGDTSIRAVGIDEAASIAMLVEEGGVVNFNGARNSIEGLVHVLTDSQLNFAGGSTTIRGDVGLDGTSTLTLSDATVRLEGSLGSSPLAEPTMAGNLGMTHSTLTITDTVKVDQLTAEASRLVYDNATASFSATNVNLKGENALTVAASGRLNDASGDASELIKTIAENTVLSGSNAETVVLEEGLIRGEVVGTVDQDGKVTIMKDAGASTSVNSLADAMSANLLIWRNDMHSITKRIDDVRDGAGTGAWVHLEGGSLSLDGASLDDFVTLSTGLDVRLPTDANLRAGVAFGYTDGDLSIEAGDGTSKIYEFTLYGAWTGENGLFADASATYARLSNEFNTSGLSADYDADAFAAGARVGMRFELPANLFVEPAIEASYGRVSAESFRAADGVEGKQSSMDSLVGTTGVRFGWTAPDDRGSLYANLSVSHDFLGETDVSMTNSAQTVTVSKDYGDTWVTFGLGGRLALTERTSIAAEVERTAGGDVDLDWRALVNLRYAW